MIKVFHDSKYGSIRTSCFNDEAALCLKDLCHLLHIKNIPECRGKLDEKYVRQIEVDEKGSKKEGSVYFRGEFEWLSFSITQP